MKTIILILFTLLGSQAMAQNATGKISGNIQEENQSPLPYSNVVVYSLPDSSMITGTVTTETGDFEVRVNQNQRLYVKISAVGYSNYFSPALELNESQTEITLEPIQLKEDIEVMNAVEVKALRPLVVVEADKMVVTVEGTAMAAGASAYEVLEKSPGVFVDQDGNIQLNGKSGVQVMIDGRRTYLSATDLQNMLMGMSADNIKNIEIINNPSAKYDAEGNAGIINITLKKNTMQGFNGNVNAGYRYNEMQNYNAGLQLNHKNGPWNSFVNADLSQRGRIRDAEMYREINQTNGVLTIFDQEGKEYVNRVIPSLRLGTDFDLNEMQSIGAMVNLYGQDVYHDFNIGTDLNQSGNESFIGSANRIDYRFLNSQANLHYTHKLDTNGTKLTADINYVKLVTDGGASFVNSYYLSGNSEPSEVERLENENPFSFDIYSAQTDFEGKIFNDVKVEAGLKASHVVSDNELTFYEVEGDLRQVDENRSNHFVYTEQILAAYTSFSGKLSEKLSFKAGLRAEQTYSAGESLTLNTVNERDYLNFFPSFFLQHNTSKSYQANLNYSRRIDRPNYHNLNPFVMYLDPYTWAQGNPYLRPQMTHSMTFTQTFFGKFNWVMYYGLTTDFIAEIPFQNPEDGTTVFKQDNVKDQLNYSTTVVVPLQPFKWWSVNGNATVFYQKFSTYLFNEQVENEATSVVARVANTFMLPKDFKVELNADYNSPTVWALYTIDSQWGVDFAVKKSFLDRKLEAALNVTDIFRTRKFRGNSNFNGNINQINQYFGQQSIGFSLRYRFSKGEEFKAKQRNTNLDELNRAGG